MSSNRPSPHEKGVLKKLLRRQSFFELLKPDIYQLANEVGIHGGSRHDSCVYFCFIHLLNTLYES